MEKSKIKVDYKGSGVKLAKGLITLSKIFMWLSVALAVIELFMMIVDYEDSQLTTFLIGLGGILNFIILTCVFEILSSIAKTALYKRCILEQTYEFEEEELVVTGADVYPAEQTEEVETEESEKTE